MSPDVCACEIHESGTGVKRCLYHEDVIREHQKMYLALRAIASGVAPHDDVMLVVDSADEALQGVSWRV